MMNHNHKMKNAPENHSEELAGQISEDDEMLCQFPGKITKGERREALRRLFITRLGWALNEKVNTEDHPVPEADPDQWLEQAIGETIVRAYALGMLHSRDGAKAEVSKPNLVQTEQGDLVQSLDWQGKPADLRPCDQALELLHQVLRDCLPTWCDEPSSLGAIRGRIAQINAHSRPSWLAGALPLKRGNKSAQDIQ